MLAYLHQELPFNSHKTRSRYAHSIATWSYNEEGTISLPRAVWQAYGDEALLQRVLAACWLLRIPPLQRLVTDEIGAIALGEELTWDRVAAFIERNAVGGGERENKTRIPLWLERMGFVQRAKPANAVKGAGKTMTVLEPYFDRTAFLLVLHAELTPGPRTVTVAELLEHPFWRCLGGRDPRQVRDSLTAAARAGAIDRYTRIDQLEQATTRYTLAQLLERRVRL